MIARKAAAAAAGIVLLAGWCAAQTKATARPPETDGGDRVILDWETFKKISGFRDDGAPAGTVAIPWAEVEDLLHIKIRDMSGTRMELPWREFRQLLQWSLAEKERAKPAPPADFVVGETTYTGRISRDGAVIAAAMKIHVLQEKGWKRIPLLPAQVALRSVTVPEGAILSLAGNFYELVTERTGEMECAAEFAVAVQEQAGINRFSFPRVRSSTCVLDLLVEQKDAAVAVDKAQALAKKQEGDAVRVLAALPADAPVTVSWERAIPEIERVPAKIYAETRTLAAVGEGIISCRERISLNVLHTGVREIDLAAPDGVSILEVAGQKIRDWRVRERTVTVLFDADVIGGATIDVSYEKDVSKEPSLGIPVIHPASAAREKGFIGVVALGNVEISSPAQTGAASIDVRELPAEILGMTSQPILLAYRYINRDFTIPLAVKKHDDVDVLVTIIDAAAAVAMQTADGRRITKITYAVRNNRNQFLRLALPAGGEADVWSAMVGGRPTRPAKDGEGRILIPLVRSEGGSDLSSFPVELVYVEKVAPFTDRGAMKMELPLCSQPVTRATLALYLPAEGTYTEWTGSLRRTDAPGRPAPTSGPAAADGRDDAKRLADQFQQRVGKEAAAAGVTPIRVQLPITGAATLFEKVLVLGDPLTVECRYQYRPRRR